MNAMFPGNMVKRVSHGWRALESVPGLSTVAAGWQRLAKEEAAGLLAGLMQPTDELGHCHPCPHGCGCTHRVVHHDDGRIVGVCECDPWNCDNLELTEEAIRIHQLSWAKLGRGMARAFGCEFTVQDFGIWNAQQVALFSAASVPLVVSIQPEQEAFRNAVMELVAVLKRPFILFAPTNRFYGVRSIQFLKDVNAEFFDLESHVEITANGTLLPIRGGAELFTKFLPKEPEVLPEDVARRAYGLVKQLDSDRVAKPPTVLSVFRQYCLEEMSVDEIAEKWRCSKGTVANRLKFIREATGMEPEQLRQMSGQFEKIEDDVRSAKAASIYRRNLIDDSDDGERDEHS